MLNEWLLDDATRCPGCAQQLRMPRTERCHGCAIRLTGPQADRLWQIGVSAARLLRQREALLEHMRVEARQALTRPAVPPPAPTPTAAPAAAPAPVPATASAPARPPAARVREMAEVGRRRVARIVLGAGVLLVVLAAVVFVAVTWNRTGTGGRALVMALALVLCAAGTTLAERRELPATAEAMAALTVAMGLLDGYAAWAADLAGVRDGSAMLVGAATLLAVGGAAALGSVVAPLRALRISAALLLQGPLPLVIAWFGVGRASLLPLAIGLGLQAAVDVVLLRRIYAEAARGLRIVAEVGVLCYWLTAVVLTFAEGASGASAGTMLALAAIAGGIAFVLRRAPVVRHLASASAMAGSLAATALLLATRPAGEESDLPIAWAGVGLLLVVLVAMAPLFAVPRGFRAGPLAVLVPLTVAPAFWVVATPAVALAGPLSWPRRAWSLGSADTGSRDAIMAGSDWDFGLAPLVLLPAAALVALTGVTLLRGRPGRTPVLVTAAVAAEGLFVVLPPALDLPLWAALGWHLVAAVGWGCAWRVRPWLPLLGPAHGALALAWATAHPLTSIVVWAIAAAGLTITAVLSPGRPASAPNSATAPGHTTTADAHVPVQNTADASESVEESIAPPIRKVAAAPGGLTDKTTSAPDDRGGSTPRPHDADTEGDTDSDADAGTDDDATDHPERPTPLPLPHLIRSRAAALALALAGVDVAMTAAHAGASTTMVGFVPALLFALVTLIALALRPTAPTTRALTLVGATGWAVGSLATAGDTPVPLAVTLAAALTVSLVGTVRDLPGIRPAWAGAAALWWVGTVAAGAHAFGADRPGTVLAAVIAAALLFPLAIACAGRPGMAVALEGTGAATLLGTLLVGRETSPVVFAIAAAATLCGALFGRTMLRPGWAPATAVLLYATTAATLYRLDVGVSGQAVAGACAAAILLVVATYLHDLPMAAIMIEAVAVFAAAVSIARSDGLLPVALAVVTAGTLHSALRGHGETRPVWAPATVVLCTATVAATLYRLDATDTVSALAAVGTAALSYIAVARLPRPAPAATLAAAACVLVAGTATAAVAPEQIWLVLAWAGVAAATTPAGPLRTPARLAALPLLFAAYWLRLALSDVTHPEAYTIPLGLVLLVEGMLRRRAHPDTDSWAAYGGPLAVLLLPSLPLAVSQGEPIRPSLLGAAAIVTLLVGARFRLQAPLFLGATVLATVGLVHLLPHLAPVYDAVPRWAVLGTAGLLLIVIGAGYERRLRDLKRLRRAVGRLG
ncbi:SCO7613 C-terminal domain-containing membrane protein [Embleya sp. NPDC050493]|uniref:SCO7613 C-terminal domain-containing membrane protein n=1 Tax=Embleya sp. NPDC050493 TaxID=3363989 RepID=UPI00378BB721